MDDEYFEVGVEEQGGASLVNYVRQAPVQMPCPAPIPLPAAPAAPPAPAAEPADSSSAPVKKPVPSSDAETVVEGGTTLAAPMPGTIISYEKQAGDPITKGETVVILEAMKMENAIPAPVSGTIKTIKERGRINFPK